MRSSTHGYARPKHDSHLPLQLCMAGTNVVLGTLVCGVLLISHHGKFGPPATPEGMFIVYSTLVVFSLIEGILVGVMLRRQGTAMRLSLGGLASGVAFFIMLIGGLVAAALVINS